MNKWDAAYYLIEAKKRIDSLMYIDANINELKNINIKEKCDSLLQGFYINICILLDKAKTKKELKELKKNDGCIKHIYYERDKKYAHNDDEYKAKRYQSFTEIVNEKKAELEYVFNLCKNDLPDSLTLDFVSHDRELFRLLNRVNAKIEEDINKIKYPIGTFHSYQLSNEGKQMFAEFNTEKQDKRTAKIFLYDYDIVIKNAINDYEEAKKTTKEESINSAVLFQMGINMEETIQNLQNKCIIINAVFNENVWMTFSKNGRKLIDKCKEYGLLDKFDLMHAERITPEILKELEKVKDE